jgi:hypothetical protein
MAGGEDPFRVEYVTIRDERPKAARVPNSPPAAPSLTPSQHSEGAPTCGVEPSSPLSSPSPDMVEFVSPLMTTLDLDANADDAPRRFRAMWNILGVAPTSGIADRGIVQELLAAIEEEPGSTEEVLEVKEWHTAMKEEMDSIQENKTWSPMHLPKGHRAIGLKWVFRLKHDEHSNVVRHKARLVAKGYVQCQGIDFDEVFAHVARMELVRAVLVVAAHHGWHIHHMNVKSAFLNGDLAEEVYV